MQNFDISWSHRILNCVRHSSMRLCVYPNGTPGVEGGCEASGIFPELLQSLNTRNHMSEECIAVVMIKSTEQLVRQDDGGKSLEGSRYRMAAIHQKAMCFRNPRIRKAAMEIPLAIVWDLACGAKPVCVKQWHVCTQRVSCAQKCTVRLSVFKKRMCSLHSLASLLRSDESSLSSRRRAMSSDTSAARCCSSCGEIYPQLHSIT